MIALLRGRVAMPEEEAVVIDVGGVGYRVFCDARTLAALPPAGEAVELLIETHMREGAIQLFGFRDRAAQHWFRLLQNIQGVGARLALSVLSALTPEELAAAIAAQDRSALARANGVGPRLAGRIIAELKDRLGSLPPAMAAGPAAASPGDDALGDAVSALVHLGYGRSEAHRAAMAARDRLGPEVAVDRLIREALKELAP